MKKLLSFAIVGAILLVMAFTCPSSDAHIDSISEAYAKKSIILKVIGKEYIKLAVDRLVNVDNYVLVSIGTYTMGEDNDIVSVGVFGHVFTFMKDDVLEEVERAINL